MEKVIFAASKKSSIQVGIGIINIIIIPTNARANKTSLLSFNCLMRKLLLVLVEIEATDLSPFSNTTLSFSQD